MKAFEFAVEFGFRFEYYEVVGASQQEAHARLWNDMLAVDERASVSSIECVSVRDWEPDAVDLDRPAE